MSFRDELVQIAAICLAAAQQNELGHTEIGATNDGIMGRFALQRMLNEITDARRRGHEARSPDEWKAYIQARLNPSVESLI